MHIKEKYKNESGQNNNIYYINEAESRRINIAKVWFTIMVIYIHSYSEAIKFTAGSVSINMPLEYEMIQYILSQAILRCAVPAFFLISSILLYRKQFLWKNNIKKKIKTLLVPYIILNGFWIFFYLVCQNIPMLSVYFANEENNVSSWGIIEWLDAFIGFEDSYPILYPLWFIRDLFILNLCANVIKWIVDKFPKTVAIALVAIWLFLGGKHIFFQAICFWGIGCFIVNRKIKLSVVDNIKSIFLWIIYIAFIAIDVWAKNYSWHGIFHRINLLLGIIFWYACMTKFCNYKLNKLLIWLSTYSFSIYLFHEMSLSILKKLCAKFLPMTAEFILIEYLFIPIIILTGCVVISVLMKRVMPGVYGLLTGHRKN